MAFAAVDLCAANDFSGYSLSIYDRQFIQLEEVLRRFDSKANEANMFYSDFNSFIAYYEKSRDLKMTIGKFNLFYNARYTTGDGTIKYRFSLTESLSGSPRYYAVEAFEQNGIKFKLKGL